MAGVSNPTGGVPFEKVLPSLCAAEAALANGDPERLGAMIEVLSRSLGFTVAIAAQGHGPTIDEMLGGANDYAHAEAVDKAPFARMMSRGLGR